MTVAPQGEQNPAYRPTPLNAMCSGDAPVAAFLRGGGFFVPVGRWPPWGLLDFGAEIKKSIDFKSITTVPEKLHKNSATVVFVLDLQAKIP